MLDLLNKAISVNNRGDVIPLDKIASIFDPMVRIAVNASQNEHDYTERTSLGIGLYISREIVHAHDGRIDVMSNMEDGTTFAVTMPRLPTGFQNSDLANHEVLKPRQTWSQK